QIQEEIQKILTMVDTVYSLFGIEYRFRLSTRPESFMGSAAMWDLAEEGLKQALNATGKPYEIDPGEGAFYGPKIDVTILDSLGREWQCGTTQLDFQLPERFELEYVTKEGTFERPIVIHRAIYGSFERFMGILIEHLGGAFPTWLAPIQAVVIPISEKHNAYAHEVRQALKQAKIRAIVNEDNETLNYRIRKSETEKIPYMLVVGDREASEKTVAVRRYRSKGKSDTLTLEDLKTQMLESIRQRTLDVEIEHFSDLFRKPSEAISTEKMAY
ncbi:MAG: His/Gly/Thr/Pro-type tRNA ligase C-terminal domain-containing protein, partial [Vampirovibrionales bacterium]